MARSLFGPTTGHPPPGNLSVVRLAKIVPRIVRFRGRQGARAVSGGGFPLLTPRVVPGLPLDIRPRMGGTRGPNSDMHPLRADSVERHGRSSCSARAGNTGPISLDRPSEHFQYRWNFGI